MSGEVENDDAERRRRRRTTATTLNDAADDGRRRSLALPVFLLSFSSLYPKTMALDAISTTYLSAPGTQSCHRGRARPRCAGAEVDVVETLTTLLAADAAVDVVDGKRSWSPAAAASASLGC